MAVSAAIGRARERRAGRRRGDERANRLGADERHIDRRHEDRVDAGTIGGVQPGKQRRQLSAIRVLVDDEARRAVERLDFVPQPVIFWASHNQRIARAARKQDGDNLPHEGRPLSIASGGQQRFRLAHAGRKPGGEHDSGNHVEFY